MSFICPACCISHNNRQVPASRGAYCDYDICSNAIKKEAEKIQDDNARSEFMRCSREFMNQHCRESADARKKNPTREDYPIISKPLLFYRNTATDSDDWRRRND